MPDTTTFRVFTSIAISIGIVILVSAAHVIFHNNNEQHHFQDTNRVEINIFTKNIQNDPVQRSGGNNPTMAELDKIAYFNRDASVQQFLKSSPKWTDLDKIASFGLMFSSELLAARIKRKFECGLLSQASSIDCSLCALVINGLNNLISHGSTKDEVVVFATKACIDLKIENERVCKAVVKEFEDELFGVATQLARNPDEVCGYVLGTDCGAPYNPEADWNVTFPDIPKPPVVDPVLPKPGSPTMRILHITDFHYDAEYQAGTNAECGEPLCCRANDGSPAPGHAGAGTYGDFRNCDSPMITLQSLFKHLNATQDQFDFVIFTGDIPAHNVWNQSRDDQLTAMQAYINIVKKYLPNKMVFNTLGNHESAPVNSFPPPFITGNDSESWLYTATAKNWLNWLPADTEATIKRGGFYSTTVLKGLKLISLNMNMCNNGNWWLFINDTDPAGMLQWMISELQEAENNGDKVYIIGHIMPGCGCCLKPFSWNFYKIVNRYEGTIVEMFFGHSHADYWEMFYDQEKMLRPLGVAYIPGSITTYSDKNPGYRIYEIDGNYNGTSWKVQDYTNYFLNLTKANQMGVAFWEKEYSAKEEYGLPSLFPKDWNNLIYQMKTDDNLYNKFCLHFSKSNAASKCEDRKGFLCQLKTGRNGDPHICDDL